MIAWACRQYPLCTDGGGAGETGPGCAGAVALGAGDVEVGDEGADGADAGAGMADSATSGLDSGSGGKVPGLGEGNTSGGGAVRRSKFLGASSTDPKGGFVASGTGESAEAGNDEPNSVRSFREVGSEEACQSYLGSKED